VSRLWMSGYRSYELNVFSDQDDKLKVIKYALTSYLTEQIEDGVDWLITGGQLGVEQWCAEVGLELKKIYPELKVAMMYHMPSLVVAGMRIIKQNYKLY